MRTRTRVSPLGVILALALLFGGAAMILDMSGDRKGEQPATLVVVWGDGTQIAGGCRVSWYTTAQGTHHQEKAGRQQPLRGEDTGTEHWEEIVLVLKGDKIILQGAPHLPRVPIGTSIHVHGHTYSGGARLEIVVP